MTILADHQIARLVADGTLVIKPFVDRKVRIVDDRPVISFGLSSFGYDIRVADEWMMPISGVLDPKDPEAARWRTWRADSITIPPGSFVLARSVERFEIPQNVMCLVVGKSTNARCALVLNTTPLEPLWEGHITLEISNTAPVPARVYANEGIGQVLFFEGEACETPYTGGKYDNQGAEIVPARV